MKIYIKVFWGLTATLIFAGTLALASKTFAFKLNLCKEWENIGTVVMRLRQSEAPIETMLDLAKQQTKFEEFMLDITNDTYSRPLEVTQEAKDKSIKSFASEVYLICYLNTDVKEA